MTTSLALGARATMLDGLETFMATGAGTATLVLYQGVIALATFNLQAAPFGAAVRDAIVLASAPISNTGTAVAGYVNRAILNNRASAQAVAWAVSGIGGGGDIQIPALTVTAAASQRLNGLIVRIGPSGLITPEGSFSLQ